MVEIKKILFLMEKEARKRKAPVFTLESGSRETAFHTLVATMLSSRTKDEKTIEASRRLFAAANSPRDILLLPKEKLERLILGVGFYHTKAKHLKKMSEMLIEKFGGKVPSSIGKLLALPGVGRKTANIVLARVFNRNVIGVDTHVHRISNRLGWVKTRKPEETEKALMRFLPKNLIKKINKIMVAYGQTVCLPVKPRCSECVIASYCPKVGVRTWA